MKKLCIGATFFFAVTQTIAATPEVSTHQRTLASYKGLQEVEIEKHEIPYEKLPQNFADECPELGGMYNVYGFSQGGKEFFLISVDTSGPNFSSSHFVLSSSVAKCKLIENSSKNEPGFQSVMHIPQKNYSMAIPLLNGKNELRYLLMEEKRYPGKYSEGFAGKKPLTVSTYGFSRALYEVTPKGFKLVKESVKNGIKTDASVDAVIPMSTLLESH